MDSLETTPEMVEAGLACLLNYDPQFSNEQHTVVAIFQTMVAARSPLG